MGHEKFSHKLRSDDHFNILSGVFRVSYLIMLTLKRHLQMTRTVIFLVI